LANIEGAGYVETGPAYFQQGQFNAAAGFSENFAQHACYATSILNELSEQYTTLTGDQLTFDQAVSMMNAAIAAGDIRGSDAFVEDNENVANTMWATTGIGGNWDYRRSEGYDTSGQHEVFERAGHFEGSYTGGYMDDSSHAYDPYDGTIDDVSDGFLDGTLIISTRIFTYRN
jgi:hypothetical protein